jgi:DNA invertase Pin-like site-specific DNA recombinase
MIVGYARVSTDGQTLDAQQSALTAAGAEKTFSEKVSGAVTDRKALARAIAALGPGGRAACNAAGSACALHAGLAQCLDAVGKTGAGFRSLADAWADTTTRTGG